MAVLLEAILFGITVLFILVGLAGIILPILPGTIIIWLSVLVYAFIEDFQAIDWFTFIVITLVAIVTGTSDIWLSLLGAKTVGAARRALIYGVVGSIVGFFLLGWLVPVFGNLFGGVIGYSTGVLLGQYHKHRDWNLAIKASLGGLAGWGVATVVQFVGGLLILLLFIWQVLSYQG